MDEEPMLFAAREQKEWRHKDRRLPPRILGVRVFAAGDVRIRERFERTLTIL